MTIDPNLLLHWFWPGFFTFLGVFMWWRPPVDASCAVCTAGAADYETASRIRRVWSKRRDTEEIAPLIRLLPVVASFAFAVATAFTPGSNAIYYGALMLIISASAAGAYLQIRNRFPVRVAVLQQRTPGSVIPIPVFALITVQALLALVALQMPGAATKIGAVFVSISSLFCTWLAWRVTEMPALLAGDDVLMEQFVDARLRFQRAASILIYASVQSFVFLSFAHAPHWSIDATALLWVCYSAWYLVRTFRKQDLNRVLT